MPVCISYAKCVGLYIIVAHSESTMLMADGDDSLLYYYSLGK